MNAIQGMDSWLGQAQLAADYVACTVQAVIIQVLAQFVKKDTDTHVMLITKY